MRNTILAIPIFIFWFLDSKKVYLYTGWEPLLSPSSTFLNIVLNLEASLLGIQKISKYCKRILWWKLLLLFYIFQIKCKDLFTSPAIVNFVRQNLHDKNIVFAIVSTLKFANWFYFNGPSIENLFYCSFTKPCYLDFLFVLFCIMIVFNFFSSPGGWKVFRVGSVTDQRRTRRG